MNAQAELLLYLAASAIGFMANAFWVAGILMWRARKLEQWSIPYWKALIVQLKAVGLATLFMIAAQAVGPAEGGETVQSILRFMGLIVWFFTHSSAVHRLATAEGKSLEAERARRITWSVLGFSAGATACLAAVGLVLASVMSKHA